MRKLKEELGTLQGLNKQSEQEVGILQLLVCHELYHRQCLLCSNIYVKSGVKIGDGVVDGH